MLDIPRLKRIRLSRYPVSQRIMGRFLCLNYESVPGVKIRFEGTENIPDEPCIFAMNHTDRYNYFPFQYKLWRIKNRFTATWVKGKYYENAAVATFMEKMNQLPTISRGYLITRDFLEVLKRAPTSEEYSRLRDWVDESYEIGATAHREESFWESLPRALFDENRNVLGREFQPEKETYPDYVNATFQLMMKLFVGLNQQAHDVGLDILIFPQGTRSKRLLPSHTGIAELAFYLKCPVVPIGCNGSDQVYPGSSPFGKKGECIYRIGEAIQYGSIPEYKLDEEFDPFTKEAEIKFGSHFESFAEAVTRRINPLLDEAYQIDDQSKLPDDREAKRFL